MKINPNLTGTIHFIGIGGIGMSGIARVLHEMGYAIQGSDTGNNQQVQYFRSVGVKVFAQHSPDNIKDANLVVVSSAITPDNPELAAAVANNVAVIHRAEMLGELMRLRQSIAVAGTHGKTTTTSLLGLLLEQSGCDPIIVNGGVIRSYNSNIRYGQGEWMVVEADESDGSFKYLRSTIAAITNIDFDHMEHYHSLANLQQAFINFIEAIPFYGLGIINYDDKYAREIIDKIHNRRLVSYGLQDGAQIQAVNLRFFAGYTVFNVRIKRQIFTKRKYLSLVTKNFSPASAMHQFCGFDEDSFYIENIRLNLVGEHNVQNSLIVIATALELDIPVSTLRATLEAFTGVERRFTCVGTAGRNIKIIDDYAHHPTEIVATLKAAQRVLQIDKESGDKNPGKMIVVWQPHRYSRLRLLLDDFITSLRYADCIVVMPVYGAGEAVDPQFSLEFLVNILQTNSQHQRIQGAAEYDEMKQLLQDLMAENDLIIGLGAGSITYHMRKFAEEITAPDAAVVKF